MTMRYLGETQAIWEATQSHGASVGWLRRAVGDHGPSSPCLSGCRSVCWKIFLLSREGAELSWPQSLREGRERYDERRDRFLNFIKHPEALAKLAIDPLADDPESPWNTVREDANIRAEILQDVQRLPDVANYHEDRIQLMILDILFIYCKANPDRGGYRQGMHELLAPIVHVIEQDALDRAAVPIDESVDDELLEMADSFFIEHDAYVLFSQLMEYAQSFYEVRDMTNKSSDAPPSRFPQQSSSIVERSKFIHEVCLQKIDPELASHLTRIEILPQIFLIRWIRLLFSREFPFNQLLVLWDTIFAVDPSLYLMDLICCAMVIRIRWQLLKSDYSVCLQLLLKYPPPTQAHGPQTFVDDALYLRDHLNTSGGAYVIMKYSGKMPKLSKSLESNEAVTSPLGGSDSTRRKGLRMTSPIRSPSKFLQQQGGVENLFQGVLERGEKLGINQAVRDAMVEIKRNMQGLNEGQNTPYLRTVLTDEGAAKTLNAMERQNKQLAILLDETVTNLKAVSMSNLYNKAKSLELIEIAAAKVQFVQIYLQDPSMELPAMASPALVEAQSAPKANDQAGNQGEQSKENEPPTARSIEADTAILSLADKEPPVKVSVTADTCTNNDPGATGTSGGTASTEAPLQDIPPITRPLVLIPARSTIAQSSFSWMLEPDEAGPAITPPAGKSSSAQHKKRRANNASREKNAFLFGDVTTAEVDERNPLGSGDIFGMEPLQRAKADQARNCIREGER